MPKVQKPGEASFVTIPFDPDIIAELMLAGNKVYPDDELSDEEFAQQEALVFQAFDVLKARKDWGENQFALKDEGLTGSQTPSVREDADFTDRLPAPNTSERTTKNILRVQPNPFTTENMPQADTEWAQEALQGRVRRKL